MPKTELRKKKSLGQKAVEWFPSQHLDREKATEQERGLQEFIDFVVPQTKGDIALSLLPFVGMGGKKIVKKGFREGYKQFKKYQDMPNRRYTELEELKSGSYKPMDSIEEGKNFVKNWFNTYRGSKVEMDKMFMKFQDVDKITVNNKNDIIGSKNPALARYIRVDPSVSSQGSKTAIFPGVKEVQFDKALMTDYTTRDIIASGSNLNQKDLLKSLSIHEYFHAITNGKNTNLGKEVLKMIDNALIKSELSQGARVLPGAKHYNTMRNDFVPLTLKEYRYLKSPQEIYARIMQMRFELGEGPTRLTNSYVKLRKGMEMRNSPYGELKNILSHNQIEKLYNNLPAIAPLGIIPASKGKNDKNRKY